jgi:hypothetical protein
MSFFISSISLSIENSGLIEEHLLYGLNILKYRKVEDNNWYYIYGYITISTR